MQALRAPSRGGSLRLPAIVLLVLLGVLSMHGGASAAPPMTRSAPAMGGDHHAAGDPQKPAEPGHHQGAHVIDPCVAKLSTAISTVPPPPLGMFAGTAPDPTAAGDLRQQREARAGPDVDLHTLCISRT